MSITELQNLQFNLKFVGKQFGKSSRTCEKEQKQELTKCKQAMQKGNIEGAKIYAQNSIRKKNEALNFLRLAARMDAVASRLDTAVKMKMVSKSMGAMVTGMDKVLNGMNTESISRLMDTFERQFESMDVASEYMQTAIGQSVASSTPEDEVTTLMSQVAEENGLDMKGQLQIGGAALPATTTRVAQVQQDDPETEALRQRLAALQTGKS